MTEVTKFNEKNIAIFAKVEATAGIYNAPAASDAVAAVALTGSVTYTTGSVVYVGDSLSRDEYSYQTDSFADAAIDTPFQVLGGLSSANTTAAAPLSNLLQACGGSIVSIAAAGLGGLTPIAQWGLVVDNTVAADNTVSMDIRKRSVQDAVNDKLVKLNYCRGIADVSANVGDIPRFKFNMKGNAGAPEAAATLLPNFQAQTTLVAPTIRKQNMVAATISPAFAANILAGATTTATVTVTAGHGLATGNIVTISGALGVDAAKYNITASITVTNATVFTYTVASVTTNANVSGKIMLSNDTSGVMKNFTFNTLAAPNFFGFDYTRYITAAEEGFGKGAAPTDVTISILEDQAQQYTVSTITFVGTTATVTLASPMTTALTAGNTITISGASSIANPSDNLLYNITTAVTGSPTTTVFTYTMAGTPVANAVTASTSYPLKMTNNSATGFAPDLNISNFFAVRLKFGTGAGRYITLRWNKLQLADVKESKIANLTADEIKFRNTGNSFITFE